MVTKIKKSIQNSKHKAGFKARQKQRIEKKHKQSNAERNEYVDKRALLNNKGKKSKKAKKPLPPKEEADASDSEMDEEGSEIDA